MAKSLRRIALAGLLLAISCGLADAEEGGKVPKIGQLYSGTPQVYKPFDEAFRAGLRSVGYVDGKNVILLPRYANGDYAQFPRLLSELIAADVDVLFVSTAVVQAAVQATRTIPIVAPVMSDPIRDGLVTSIARPGGNLTGGSGLTEMDSKRLQFAMELVPGLKRVGLLFEATNPQFENGAKANRVIADGLGLSLHTYGVRNLDEIRSAFTRFEKDRIQVLILWPTPLMLLNQKSIFYLVATHKVPVIGETLEFAKAGALITYSVNYFEMYSHAAGQVDKILKGAKPGDLPIERPTKYVLGVNLKTARDLSITIPDSILLQADEIIR